MKGLKQLLAFTLAETLIVMGIIGVISALTLPNLNSSTGEKEKVAKVKKIYSNLTDAVSRAQAVYGPIDEWFTNSSLSRDEKTTIFATRITEFMKVSKDCGVNKKGCWSTSPLVTEEGEVYDGNYYDSLAANNAYYFVILSDGTSLAFERPDPYLTHIRFDIDGPTKGKTQLGNDIFDVIIAYYDKNDPIRLVNSEDADEGYFRIYCTAWVILNGNMDYLKANYKNNGYFECNNGKILDWTTNTTCK